MKRTAKAHWSGTLKEGKGTLDSPSGILKDTAYSYQTRFEEGTTGTNPEELLAAAHAGCFTMAVASALSKKDLKPSSLDTEATVNMEGLAITGVHLVITGSVNGINFGDFADIVKVVTKECIISKALSVPITSEARFKA
jgi:osmotically inducible protein OsmC